MHYSVTPVDNEILSVYVCGGRCVRACPCVCTVRACVYVCVILAYVRMRECVCACVCTVKCVLIFSLDHRNCDEIN